MSRATIRESRGLETWTALASDELYHTTWIAYSRLFSYRPDIRVGITDAGMVDQQGHKHARPPSSDIQRKPCRLTQHQPTRLKPSTAVHHPQEPSPCLLALLSSRTSALAGQMEETCPTPDLLQPESFHPTYCSCSSSSSSLSPRT